MAVGNEYIASGGVDGKVMFWTLSTGVLKNTVIVIPAEKVITQDLYLYDMLFLPSGDLLAALNSGELFQVSHKSPNPILLSHQALSSPLLHLSQKLNLWVLGATSGHMLLHNVASLLENDSQPQVSFRAHCDLGSQDDECVVSISSYGKLLLPSKIVDNKCHQSCQFP